MKPNPVNDSRKYPVGDKGQEIENPAPSRTAAVFTVHDLRYRQTRSCL